MTDASETIKNIYTDILNAIPLPCFIVDDDVKINLFNTAAEKLLPPDPAVIYKNRCGEVLSCIHSSQGCGKGEACMSCPIRNSVKSASKGINVVRKKAKLETVKNGKKSRTDLYVSVTPVVYENDPYYILCLEDISELMELKQLVPMCSFCKKIRNDTEYWESVEIYFKKQLEIDFSHGVCPECFKKHYPGLMDDNE